MQLKEILVELAWLNLHLKQRPVFQSGFNFARESYRMIARRPELALIEMDRSIRGDMLEFVLRDALPHICVRGSTNQETLEEIKAGTLTFLFDADGNFIED